MLKNICSMIKKLDQKEILFVGLSIAGVIANNGLMVSSPNLKCLEGVNLVEELENLVGKKVLCENDANCFVLAEQKIGAARGYKNVVGLIIGTGIGGGIIINRELYKGKTNSAGEFGRMIIHSNEEFEELCAGPGIVHRYLLTGGTIRNPDPEKIFSSEELKARQVVEDTYKFLRIGISNIIVSLNPEIIVIGGGVSNLPIYARINRDIERNLPKSFLKSAKIVKNHLGDSSGVIGAAFLDK